MKFLTIPQLFFLFMFSFSLTWAQNDRTGDMSNCKTSEAIKQFFEQSPDRMIQHQNFNEYTRNFVNDIESKKESMPSAYVIPVVFHVYGTVQNGDTVDYNTIVNSLNQVNEEFIGLNDDFNTVDANFDGIKSTLDIEFKLAKLDPNGNCTTGVIFYPEESGMGNYGSPAVARDSWDNYKYMNIYITADLYGDGVPNNSGVAWYPDTGMSNDGIARVVMNGQYLTGNTNQEFASTLTHEFGHWLNLIHTHEGGCGGTDGVADTPQDSQSSGSNNCSETSDCGYLINYENYMGYNGALGCYKMFTVGQTDRMLAALTHPSRQPLWQSSNITATGVNNGDGGAVSATTDVLEDIVNDGSFAGTLDITISNTTFVTTGNLVEGVHFNSMLPSGLTAQINVLNATEAELTINGNAVDHEEVDNESISIEFLEDATVDNLACSNVGWDLVFFDPYRIVYVDNDDLSVNSGDVWKPFTDSFIPSLGGGTNYGGLFYNTSHPSGQAALQFETYTAAMVCQGNTLNISMLPENTLISTNSNWVNGQAYPNLHDVRSNTYVVWDGETNFAGFRFAKNGLQYHGWFRFQVSNNGDSYTLIDYAYNTEPSGDIFTGQTTLSTSIDSFEDLGVSVHPNPFNESLYVSTGDLKGGNLKIEIRNALGQRIVSKEYDNVSSKVNVSDLTFSSGLYFIRIETDEKEVTKKIIKE